MGYKPTIHGIGIVLWVTNPRFTASGLQIPMNGDDERKFIKNNHFVGVLDFLL